jgi:DNA-directed RNA polymerase subunit M/transcription elongation factor TFIIS
MGNFDLSNQNEDVKEGLATDTNVNNFDNNGGLATNPVTEETGNLGTVNNGDLGDAKPRTTPTPRTTPKPRTDRSPRIKCPACGSHNIKYVTRTKEEEKNWFVICLVLMVFWPVGVYMALKKSKKTYQVKQCQDCGKEF